jgi:hypothetical protein
MSDPFWESFELVHTLRQLLSSYITQTLLHMRYSFQTTGKLERRVKLNLPLRPLTWCLPLNKSRQVRVHKCDVPHLSSDDQSKP